MAFYVGQRVVCVDNTLAPGVVIRSGETIPQLEVVYRIREIIEWHGKARLRLVDIVNPKCRYARGFAEEAMFAARKFRPVVEPKTDISIFTAMLKPKKVTEPA